MAIRYRCVGGVFGLESRRLPDALIPPDIPAVATIMVAERIAAKLVV